MSLLSQPLKAFVAVVETGAVHQAADVIGLTQTGVTQRIRALEADLGVTLFTRSRKGMRPTSEGEALYQYCKGVKELEGQMLARVRGEAIGPGSGDDPRPREVQLKILGPTSIISTRVADACLAVFDKNPHVLIHLEADDFIDRVAQVKSGAADLAIVHSSVVPNEMDSKRLKSEKFILVASKKWKHRTLKEILQDERVIDFFESDQTTARYLKHFGLHAGCARARLFINDNHALINAFIHGVGFGTLTQEVAKPYLDSGELIALNRGQAFEEECALIWYPRPQMPGYLKLILNQLR